MRFSFVLLIFVALDFSSIAQSGLPHFGKISLADMQMKDCAFDPGASACKLMDQGNMYFTRTNFESYDFTTMFERRVRIKILKDEGISYANLAIPFYSNKNEEKIIQINACTYNMEGRTIKKTVVNKSAIYQQRISKQYSELVLLFPQVKVGSVIEYKYLLQRKTAADVKDWYFQGDIPTVYSEFQVSIPSIFHFTIQPVTADSLEQQEVAYSGQVSIRSGAVSSGTTQKSFIMRKLPAIHDEPFMGAARDYLQRLSFRLSGIDYGNGTVISTAGDWEEVIAGLLTDPDFGGQVNKKFADAAALISEAKNIPETEKRVAFIYNYVKEHIYWNNQQTVYAFEGTRNAFLKKTGNSADINLLLVLLLRRAGITSVPVLFSTRDNGLVNDALPFVNQFNTVVALVRNSDKYYLLDGTDKSSPYNLVPVKIINTKGLLVEKGVQHWLEAVDTTNNFKLTTAVRGVIDTNGIMKGDIFISSGGYAREQNLEGASAENNLFKPGRIPGEFNDAKIEDTQIGNLENDTAPLEQKSRFVIPLNKSGSHFYFKINMFSGLDKNPFISTERRTDIVFGYQQEYLIFGNYVIPAGYTFEALPEDISILMPDTGIVFKRFINADNNSLNVRMSVSFKQPWYSAGAYPEFAAFYKILLSKLNEQVLIKKKDQP